MTQNPDGIYVSFPNDKIEIGKIKTPNVGGHGIVIAVDENTGNTRASTYGRDIKNSGKHGAARRITVPNFYPKEVGNPTKEELDNYAKQLVNRFPQWGDKANVSYVRGADYNKMVDYMQKAENNKGFSKTPYNLYNHNCGVYGVETINQAMPWYRRTTGAILNMVPGVLNSVIGGIVGIGHDIEQKARGSNFIQGVTNFTGAGGRADSHGWSLPWFKVKGK